jgi:hypothetical protein
MVNPSRTCVVLQPGYLPWLGYFEQVHRADVFVHLDDVQYDKHGWRNRNRIKGPSGPQWLTVPVRSGDGLVIKDVRIDATKVNWAEKHLKTIRMNYGAARFFDWLFPDLENCLREPWERIADLDIALIELLCGKLGLARYFHRSSEMILPQGRCERLIAICERLDCGTAAPASGRNPTVETVGSLDRATNSGRQGAVGTKRLSRRPEKPSA